MLGKLLRCSLLTSLMLAASVSFAAGKELAVGVDTSFMPFEFKQGEAFVGFDIDLWAEIAKDLKLPYKIHPMDFNGLIPALQTGNLDVVISGMSIKDERKKVIDFSDPYYDSGLAVMVRKDDKSIHAIKDLNGKVIAAKTGTVAIDWIKKSLKPQEVRQFPNVDQAYMELEAGRVDAAIHDAPNVLYFANTAGKGKVKAVVTMAGDDRYGIGFPKGSPLVAKVNADLKKIKSDGRYTRIYKKWFGTVPPKD
ncbi:glutamine ABC transporter substrate-binding protein GlnH [Paludibacterium yongneupense]|uniref:glutamine ABC transporter substrate-binding protein GlnH n=1 Tax=Paludibacterium yongneupense TaxID=400061 RepID=UPI0004081AB9|nr:glutamine ABC transporter substrate-binding protein GlnH [Paludibacterium yongneupense]